MRDLSAGDHLDQYLLTDVLARTAMATTFKGHDTEAGAPVCLKVPRLEYESDIVFHERFNREERIGRRLEHRNIVRALEPRMKSRVYMVTEYIAGASLRSLIEAQSLSADQSVDIACQLCAALVYLHAHGIVHRDLKPENIMVAANGDVKLLDFGIALDRKSRRITWRRLSTTMGTPDYMAPEQIRGRRGDSRCDIYAAGLILFEMLTGKLPFPDESAAVVLRAKLYDEPKPPRYFLPQLDHTLNAVICKAIERAPHDRYQSAAELLDRLRRSPVTDEVPPESGIASAHQGKAWVARVVAVLALAALASLTWFSHRVDARTSVPAAGAASSDSPETTPGERR